MKYVLCVILISLLPFSNTKGQVVAFSESAFAYNEQFNLNSNFNSYELVSKRHWKPSTKEGKTVMIIGGVTIVAGGILFLISLPNRNDPNNELAIYQLVGPLIAGAGGELIIIGGIEYLFGKRYERRHRERFSIIGNRNSIGLAYHF